MKKIVFLLILAISFASCKNDAKSESIETETSEEKTEKQSDGLTLLKGEFVYYNDAAVIQTHSEIYGVILANKFEELKNQAEKFKTKPTDMVQVEIRGKITNEKRDDILWENKIEIVEILNVSKPNPEGGELITIGKD